jgi:hypothetical protein
MKNVQIWNSIKSDEKIKETNICLLKANLNTIDEFIIKKNLLSKHRPIYSVDYTLIKSAMIKIYFPGYGTIFFRIFFIRIWLTSSSWATTYDPGEWSQILNYHYDEIIMYGVNLNSSVEVIAEIFLSDFIYTEIIILHDLTPPQVVMNCVQLCHLSKTKYALYFNVSSPNFYDKRFL